jgi:hypothetical protein
MRQDPEEVMLINAVNELATGNVSDETKGFLSSLSRVLPHKPFHVTHLCALNDQVKIYNMCQLKDLTSRGMKYIATDCGNCAKMPIEKVD